MKLTSLQFFILFLFINFFTIAYAGFYQADTMAEYCREYIKFINIESDADAYEAGVCSGYFASKIEVMELSEQICHKGELNLDTIVKEFIDLVDNDDAAKQQSATYVAVRLLQNNFSCDD